MAGYRSNTLGTMEYFVTHFLDMLFPSQEESFEYYAPGPGGTST